ncbi:hypothetical protein FRUB_10240 [Fimbriiglobus ruber]|uniref:Uncharacterized protein n=1 Tax=Fimbriiglobus ruber TaxID=1908690 RepID=A0A225DAW0_9BACT|nr:hypothetical protein FRUB_10240 [Fimbriiglobus ruber]
MAGARFAFWLGVVASGGALAAIMGLSLYVLFLLRGAHP